MNINDYLTTHLPVFNIKINTKVNDLLKVPQSSYFKYYRPIYIIIITFLIITITIRSEI